MWENRKVDVDGYRKLTLFTEGRHPRALFISIRQMAIPYVVRDHVQTAEV